MYGSAGRLAGQNGGFRAGRAVNRWNPGALDVNRVFHKDRRAPHTFSTTIQPPYNLLKMARPRQPLGGGRRAHGDGGAHKRELGRARVRSHCRFIHRGTESIRKSGMMWMSGGAKRQCDRALGRAGRASDRAHRPARDRARSHCRFVLPLIHFTPDSLTYSVPVFLKRQCDAPSPPPSDPIRSRV